MEDTRNLIDQFKGQTNEQIFDTLEKSRSALEIAIENVEHDFNTTVVAPCVQINI